MLNASAMEMAAAESGTRSASSCRQSARAENAWQRYLEEFAPCFHAANPGKNPRTICRARAFWTLPPGRPRISFRDSATRRCTTGRPCASAICCTTSRISVAVADLQSRIPTTTTVGWKRDSAATSRLRRMSVRSASLFAARRFQDANPPGTMPMPSKTARPANLGAGKTASTRVGLADA